MTGSRGATLAVGIAAALLLVNSEAEASGFALREQSGSMLGQAFAGQNAYTNDPSVIFFNPAGMSALDGTQASAITSFIFPKNEFDDDGSTTTVGVLGTNEGGDAGVNAVVPALYGMTSFGDFRVGIGVNAPFGLKTEYDDDWIGRYAATTSRLKTINVNPVISYQVTDWFSVGGGAQIQKADARLTNAAFFGAAGDGQIELQADDIGFGLTAGALITPMDGTQIGIGFRSSVHHDLEGRAEVHIPGANTINTNAQADLDTPETVGLSLFQRITDRLSLVGTVEWTNWSRFDELRVEFDTGQPDNVTEENWEDSYFLALGANYQLSQKLLLRGGVAYDQTPVPDEFRTARVPDEDRYWLALGATYAFSEMISLDVGYTHIFIKQASIEETFEPVPTAPALTGTLQGEYENSVDIFVVQANVKF
ncbi:MAG TPA: outer membrane protein transport protein [Alphaproteobacteria bacterium]|nr:outer membrane protein transport protein [Alphaproteobacteria bacterium]